MNGKGKYRAWQLFLLLLFVHPLPGCAQEDPHSFTVTLKIDSAKPGDTITFSYAIIKNGQPDFVNVMAVYKTDGITFNGAIPEPAEATISRYIIEKVDTAFQLKFLEGMKYSDSELNELKEYFLNPRKQDQYTFFLAPGETKITTTQKLRNARAEGPEALTSYKKLNAQYEALNRKLSFGIYTRYGMATLDEKAEKQLMKTIDSIRTVTNDSVYLKYAIENPASLISLYALRKSLSFPVESADKYLSVFHKLSPANQQRQSARQLLAILEGAKKTEPGQVVEDFQQPDSTGKKIALSSFRGKYVLIELWASWCIPCRKKNPGLIEIQQKYGGKNFTILGIALEEKGDRTKWLNAIKKDKLTWPQLSDFKGWDNAVARQFGVQSIPFNLLVDPKGTIIAKNVYEEELDTILSNILK